MRFGYNTNGFAHHRLEDALTILAELGYQSVALTLDHYALNPYDLEVSRQLPVVRDRLQELGLAVVIETGARFLIDPWHKHQPTLLSADEEQRELRLEFLRLAVDTAALLGAEAVSFWSGTATEPASKETLMDRLATGCRQLCEYAERRQVRLAFEPEPGMFIDTMTRWADLHQRVAHPRFGLTLDLGHLHCLGETPVGPHLRRWRDWLWNIHIEDMRRRVHDHLMFGEGDMDFAEVMASLTEIGYAGGVHVELSRHSHDAVETARGSLAFLQGYYAQFRRGI
jgi:sugar phosphate isomerase/epimerase